jgi:hypothetical protein
MTRGSNARLAVRLTIAIAALAAACTAVVTGLFLDTLRRYGLFEHREIPLERQS